jgi:hydroxymethylpyrimidine pyrophosphatase-like HAD family hydrolase
MPKEVAQKDRPYSKKGFIAIDLDGTALVQKFDKNKFYGLTHNRSDLRKSLINYMKIAQDVGYDIVILTARPELVEKVFLEPLEGTVGTKSTRSIVAALKEKYIHISEIIRASAKNFQEGLKGDPMAGIVERYRKNGAPNAEGILFDDQLKQIHDVRKKQDKHLFAYDINSPKDIKKFVAKIGKPMPENSSEKISEIQKNIDELREKIKTINNTNYKQEIRVFNKVLDDLTFRLKESEECHYEPEVDWVDKTTKNVSYLINKLSAQKQDQITHKDISNVSKAILGTTNHNEFVPNTKCERTIKNCLVYMERLPILANIKTQCKTYRTHLKDVIKKSSHSQDESIKKAQSKLKIVDCLLEKLENENPTVALEQFTVTFKQNETTLRISRTGSEFANTIRSLLSKIPLLGQLFKTDGEKLSDAIKYKETDYKNTKHYKRELNILSKEDIPGNSSEKDHLNPKKF